MTCVNSCLRHHVDALIHDHAGSAIGSLDVFDVALDLVQRYAVGRIDGVPDTELSFKHSGARGLSCLGRQGEESTLDEARGLCFEPRRRRCREPTAHSCSSSGGSPHSA